MHTITLPTFDLAKLTTDQCLRLHLLSLALSMLDDEFSFSEPEAALQFAMQAASFILENAPDDSCRDKIPAEIPLSVNDFSASVDKAGINSDSVTKAPVTDKLVTVRINDQAIVELSGQGVTYSEIAERTGKSVGYVRDRAHDLGLPPREPGPAKGNATPPTAKAHAAMKRLEFERLFHAGKSIHEITELLGYRNDEVTRMLASRWKLNKPCATVVNPFEAQIASSSSPEAPTLEETSCEVPFDQKPIPPLSEPENAITGTPSMQNNLRAAIEWYRGQGVEIIAIENKFRVDGRATISAKGLMATINTARHAKRLYPFPA